MSKRPVAEFVFKPFGAAIKAARMVRKESRKEASEALNLSPRYLANIENVGQQPSLPVFIDLVTRYSISVDQFILPDAAIEKSGRRRRLDAPPICAEAQMPSHADSDALTRHQK